MSPPNPPSTRRWWRMLPVLLVALAGVAAGLFVAMRTDAPSGAPPGDGPSASSAGAGTVGDAPDTVAAAAEARTLEALQTSLQRSQVLPSDFRTVPPFELVGGDGEPLSESVLDGRWSLLFFGYTNCPDVCPVTLSVLKEAVAELEAADDEPMQVVFVTVDPARDTPERMREYVGYFDDDFVAISGEQNAIHELTRSLGIVAAFTADDEHPEAYTVDHTASMLLVDPARRVRAKLTAPHEVGTIVADYRAIRAALN